MTDVRWREPEEGRAWIGLTTLLFLMPAALDAPLSQDADLAMAELAVRGLRPSASIAAADRPSS